MKEIVGIIASVLIMTSFLTKGEKAIRAFNMIGSAIFILYGVLLGSFSIVILNLMSIIINARRIYKLNKEEKSNETNENRN